MTDELPELSELSESEESRDLLRQIVRLWKTHNTQHDRMIHATTPEEIVVVLKGHVAGYVVERNPGGWWALTPKASEDIEGAGL